MKKEERRKKKEERRKKKEERRKKKEERRKKNEERRKKMKACLRSKVSHASTEVEMDAATAVRVTLTTL